jgi:hypothetical protein
MYICGRRRRCLRSLWFVVCDDGFVEVVSEDCFVVD